MKNNFTNSQKEIAKEEVLAMTSGYSAKAIAFSKKYLKVHSCDGRGHKFETSFVEFVDGEPYVVYTCSPAEAAKMTLAELERAIKEEREERDFETSLSFASEPQFSEESEEELVLEAAYSTHPYADELYIESRSEDWYLVAGEEDGNTFETRVRYVNGFFVAED